MFRHVFLGLAVCCLVPTAATAQSEEVVQSAKARVEAFLAKPDIKRRKLSADNGDPYSMVWLSDALDKEFNSLPVAYQTILPLQVRYLMGAIEKGYGPAFKRMGDIVYYGRTPEGTRMDAANFYRGGGEAGDFDSAYQFWKMARDVKVCTVCTWSEYSRDFRFTPTFNEREQAQMEGKSFASADYLEAQNTAYQRAYLGYFREKKEMVAQAVGILASDAFKDNWQVQSILASDYLYGVRGPVTSQLRSGDIERGEERSFLEPQREKAGDIYRRFADKGEIGALVQLSKLHLTGTFPEFAQDRALFLKYGEAAAEKGNIETANLIGNVMVRGKPFGTDFDLAAKYLFQAHQGGNVSATTDLAYMFLEGRGVEANEKLSLDLFEQAGNHGSSKAASFLAEYWTKGLGGTRNPLRAKIWTDKAAENLAAEKRGAAQMDRLNELTSF